MAEDVTKEKLQQLLAKKLQPGEIIVLDDQLETAEAAHARTGNIDSALASRLERSIVGADHLTYSQLAGYADDELSPPERASIADHLEFCHECRSDAEELIQLRPASATTPAASQTGWFVSIRDIFYRPVPIFASVVVLGAIGLSVWLFSSREAVPADDDVIVASSDPDPVLQQVQPAQDNPSPEKDTSEALTLSLNDGEATVGITAGGEISGYEGLPASSRSDVKRALSGAAIDFPDLRDLKAASGAFMSENSNSAGTFRINSPVGKVVLTNSPSFSWQAVPGADSYTVEVYDLNFKKVASSGQLSSPRWTTTLPRGQTYVWQVTARKGEETLKAPRPPASEARFRIVDDKFAREITTLRRSHSASHLPLAIAYAKTGMIDEAIRELETVAKQNPRSGLPRRLIRQLRQAR